MFLLFEDIPFVERIHSFTRKSSEIEEPKTLEAEIPFWSGIRKAFRKNIKT
jgi:hypothetical protein